MKMSIRRLVLSVVVIFFTGAACSSTNVAVTREVPRITKEELKAQLDSGDIVIVDVRIPKDYGNSDKKIKGAVRENPMDVRYWTPYPKDKTIVLYCA